MTQHMTDRTVLSHIERLVAEEKRLYAKGVVSDSERARLNQIDIELDRCWDLLRQRRALREFGRNPDEAEVRAAALAERARRAPGESRRELQGLTPTRRNSPPRRIIAPQGPPHQSRRRS